MEMDPPVPSQAAPAGPILAGELSLLSPEKMADLWSKEIIVVLSN